jgi:hypothetical protein
VSVRIEVVCDRCKVFSEGHLTQKGWVRPDEPGWRYVSRDINLCAKCSEDFEVWRNDAHRVLSVRIGQRLGIPKSDG